MTSTETLVLQTTLKLSYSPFLDKGKKSIWKCNYQKEIFRFFLNVIFLTELQDRLAGNPLIPLPDHPGPRDESIAHAPKRHHKLTEKEKKVK